MGEHQLAFEIDSELKQRLENEARWQGQSESEVAAQAIRGHLDRQTHLRHMLELATVEADKGVFISQEAMMRWVNDLFSGKKSPPPEPDVFLPPSRHL